MRSDLRGSGRSDRSRKALERRSALGGGKAPTGPNFVHVRGQPATMIREKRITLSAARGSAGSWLGL